MYAHYLCLEDHGNRERNKIHHAQIAIHKTRHSWVVVKTYHPYMSEGGIKIH